MAITPFIRGSATRRIALMLAGLLASLACALAVAAPPSHAQASNVVPGVSHDGDFGCGKRMTTRASYFRSSNRVFGHTTLINNCQLLGFHAKVYGILGDGNGVTVGGFLELRYGIDARGLCYPKLVRVFPPKWKKVCPPTAIRTVTLDVPAVGPAPPTTATTLTIQHEAAPNSLLQSLGAFEQHVNISARMGKTVADTIAAIKAANG